MSKRRRHASKQQENIHQIEWLTHRTGYPSAEERKQIIQMRQEISMELIKAMITQGKSKEAQIQYLASKYGPEEVERATQKFNEIMELPSLIADDVKIYRLYRQRYARFGAGLKFYTNREIEALQDQHLKTVKELDDINQTTELDKLLLYGWRDWDDITPPAIPSRSDDFAASQPASYPAPINELLEWGDELHKSHDFVDETEYLHWKKYIPALTRMALDKGLLNGWPAEKASWAPWHAIHALGNLQAWESAPALASLADLENDWLSDHLPHIWAEMGLEVEPSLWMILENSSASEKQRGLAAQSLYMITEENEAMENKVIKGFEKVLGNAKNFNPTVNAYIIHFLNQMEAVEDVWETIELAFDEDRVDLDIITPEDLEADEFDV